MSASSKDGQQTSQTGTTRSTDGGMVGAAGVVCDLRRSQRDAAPTSQSSDTTRGDANSTNWLRAVHHHKFWSSDASGSGRGSSLLKSGSRQTTSSSGQGDNSGPSSSSSTSRADANPTSSMSGSPRPRHELWATESSSSSKDNSSQDHSSQELPSGEQGSGSEQGDRGSTPTLETHGSDAQPAAHSLGHRQDSEGESVRASSKSSSKSSGSRCSSVRDLPDNAVVILGPTENAVMPNKLEDAVIPHPRTGVLQPLRSRSASVSLREVIALRAYRLNDKKFTASFGSLNHLCGDTDNCRTCIYEAKRKLGCSRSWSCDFCHLHALVRKPRSERKRKTDRESSASQDNSQSGPQNGCQQPPSLPWQ